MGKLIVGVNDLATVHPELLYEWDYEKNDKLGIYPDKVSYGSNKKVWWKCNKGHSWISNVGNRARLKSGCPFCAGQKVIVGVNDLETLKPYFLKEWNYSRNINIVPSQFMLHSGKKVWWKCDKGHEWQDSISHRSSGRKCPYCSNRKVLKGYNDLLTLRPDLAEQWNYNKNGSLKPFDVVPGSTRKVWWKCKICNYEWQSSLNSRYRGIGCPKCNSIYGSSFCEQAIFYCLKKYLGNNVEILNRYKFLDNKKSYEVDIFIPSIAFAIEYDGEYWHKNKKKTDNDKNLYLSKIGINLVRIKESNKNLINNNNIFFNYHHNKFKNLLWAIKSMFIMIGFSNIDLNIDIKENQIDILNMYHKIEIENSLAIVNPELTKEWNYEKNGDLKPTNVTSKSGYNVWWKCSKCGYEWQTTINNRSYGKGCPKCAYNIIAIKKSLPKEGQSLQDKFPHLLKEWNYNKNGNLLPSQVSFGSNKKVWWKCDKGHEWIAVVSSRVKGVGCPICTNKQLLIGYNDLATRCPELIKEWNYERNGNLLPSQTFYGSHKKVWWKCNKGHEWQTFIDSRSNRGVGCPVCSNNKVFIGYNDLITTYPELAKEWNYNKNGDLLPSQVVYGSHKKVWWKCKCGHEWIARINSRVNGNGCPICSNKQILIGYNDLTTTNPNLANEWDYNKNGNLLPVMVMANSGKKVWWKCSEGHEWQASIVNRNRGTGCPECAKLKRKKKE